MRYPFIELQKSFVLHKLISETEYCKPNNGHFFTGMIF